MGSLNFTEFQSLQKSLLLSTSLEIKIISDSMEPLIKVGDKIFCSPLKEELKPFDIIVFFQRNILVCHIVIKKSEVAPNGESFYITSSYKYASLDHPVDEKMILGKVTSHRLTFFKKWGLLFKLRKYKIF